MKTNAVKIMTFVRPLTISAFALFSTSAQAASVDVLDLLQSFNTVALGDLNASSETEGTVYVGNDFNSRGYTVNSDNLAQGTIGSVTGSLIVGGDVNGADVNVNNGTTQIGGADNVAVNDNSNSGVNTGVSIPTADVTTALTSLSAELGSLATTDGASADLSDRNGTLINSGTGEDGIAVLNLSVLESMRFLANGANGGFAGISDSLTTIINLRGTSLAYTSNFNVDNSNVLLNFVDTANLSINGGAFGFSILAPLADITATSGGVNGTVVGNNIFQSIEFRPFDDTTLFSGTLPTIDVPVSAVPLPAAAWMLLAALGGLGLVRRRAV